MTQTNDDTKNSYHHGNLYQALIEAATAIINEQGADNLTMRQLGERVGVSRAAPYRHFADKGTLLAAVAAAGFEQLRIAMKDLRQQKDKEPLAMLQEMGVGYIQFAVENKALYQLMLGARAVNRAEQPTVEEAAQETFVELLKMIAFCQEKGAVRSGDTRQIAYTVWSTAHGLADLVMQGHIETEALPQLAQKVTALVSEGIA